VVAPVWWAFQAPQGGVETLFGWGGKRLHHFAANIFRKLYTVSSETPRFCRRLPKIHSDLFFSDTLYIDMSYKTVVCSLVCPELSGERNFWALEPLQDCKLPRNFPNITQTCNLKMAADRTILNIKHHDAGPSWASMCPKFLLSLLTPKKTNASRWFSSMILLFPPIVVALHSHCITASVAYVKQVAQLPQTDRAAGWVSFGQNISGRLYFAPNAVGAREVKILIFSTTNPLLYKKTVTLRLWAPFGRLCTLFILGSLESS